MNDTIKNVDKYEYLSHFRICNLDGSYRFAALKIHIDYLVFVHKLIENLDAEQCLSDKMTRVKAHNDKHCIHLPLNYLCVIRAGAFKIKSYAGDYFRTTKPKDVSR